MDDMEVRINATKDQIEDFTESILWKDIKNELKIWQTAAMQEYAQVIGNVIEGNSGIENSDMHLGSLYGRERTIDFLLGLPEMFLQLLEDKVKEKEDESRSKSTD